VPKETFHNLSDEKKRTIFDAAVQEFSTRRFSEASINQIIKTAGISRGSFYQYFNDKEDLYLYMLEQIGKEKLDIIGRAGALKPDADFFEAYLDMTRSAIEWSNAKPDYYRIGMLMELDVSDFIVKLRALTTEGFAVLRKMIERDQQRGLIKPDLDSGLIVEMIYALNMHFFKEHFHTGTSEQMLKRAEELLKIIKEGVAVQD
jgi:TetR/AcrR family transcriptional regulator